MRQYAMYGGSFDPIHIGHLSIVERAINLGYNVLIVPAYRHAFGKQSAPFDHRVRMCELALQDTALAVHARVSILERKLGCDVETPVYTYDVLCALRTCLPSTPCLLVGPDIASEWDRWHQHAEIDREFGRLPLSMIHPIRSSFIRQQLRDGAATWRVNLSESVRDYIAAHSLYS